MQHPASESWQPVPRRRIYLMRHADVEYFDAAGRPAHPDHVSLTERGRVQTAAAATALGAIPFDGVITSGLPRTEQTADGVLNGRVIERRIDPRWREIQTRKLGDFSALDPCMVRDAILGALPDDLSGEHRFLNGETFGELAKRVQAAYLDLVNAPDWHNLLVVAHGLINRVLLASLLGAPLGAVGKIEQDACCINLIEVGADLQPLVRLVNFTPANLLKSGMTLSTLEGLCRQFLRGGRES